MYQGRLGEWQTARTKEYIHGNPIAPATARSQAASPISEAIAIAGTRADSAT
jgi:hypothetical protein